MRAIEEIAATKLPPPYIREFAAIALLKTYASLRFSDFQRLRSFEINADSARGALLTCQPNKQHGKFQP